MSNAVTPMDRSTANLIERASSGARTRPNTRPSTSRHGTLKTRVLGDRCVLRQVIRSITDRPLPLIQEVWADWSQAPLPGPNQLANPPAIVTIRPDAT